MMLRKLLRTDKVQDGAVTRGSKLVETDYRGHTKNSDSRLEGMANISQSLPDLMNEQALGTDFMHPSRSSYNESYDIRIGWPNADEVGSIHGDVISQQHQSNVEYIPHSVGNLQNEKERALSCSPVLSSKKTVLAERRSNNDDPVNSSPQRMFSSLLELSGGAKDFPEIEITKSEEQPEKPQKMPEESSSNDRHDIQKLPAASFGRITPNNLEVPSGKPIKRSKVKTRKRPKTMAGSLLVPPETMKRLSGENGSVQSDGETTGGGGVLGKSMPGWRSASLKSNTTGKSVESGITGPKLESITTRSLPTYVSISKLNNYIVLVSDNIEENGEVQAVKVDLTQNSFPVTPEKLASYLEETTHNNGPQKTISSIAILVPSSRNLSAVLTGILSQFVNAEKKLCLCKGNVALVRFQSTWSYSRYLFLTSEYLLVMKQKSATTFKLKKKAAVGELWLAAGGSGLSGEMATDSSALSFVFGWPMATNYAAVFTKPEQKMMWMSAIEKQITDERRKDNQPDVIIKINFTQDTECTMTKSLAVSCEETVSQVIERCLKELHLVDSDPKTFELCVKTRDGVSPLIGHEVPFYIQKKNIPLKKEVESQQAKLSPQLQDSGTNSLEHFILRPRKVPQKSGFRQWPRHPRRLTLTGFFGKKSLPSQPDVIQSTPKAKLFGRSLAEVCSDDSLPKPIMDLLRCLYLKGPATPGIFRKSGNHRDMLELKSRLDAGDEYNMDAVSIHTAASAIKSWLRSLPDCLLLSNLYCKWIDAICINDKTERRDSIKRLVSQLPRSNLVILQYLVCVFEHVAARSTFNHMTSGNLSICLGPTILWPEGTVDLTSECVAVELVARLAQLLIDDASEILGSDCLELFQDLKGDGQVETEMNYESEDSLCSQEMLNKSDRQKAASLESLDNSSFDDLLDTQSCNAMQSQMSIDSGLAVSNPLLNNDPDSPTTANRLLTVADHPRYAKRKGNKKKNHTKSELSDISEAHTVVDNEERLSSKMAGASNVRQRVNRFRASKSHPDDSQNDSCGDSSEDDSTNVSLSSSENFGDGNNSVVSSINQDTDGLSHELDRSLESNENDELVSSEIKSRSLDSRVERSDTMTSSKTVISLTADEDTKIKEISSTGSKKALESESGYTDFYFTEDDAKSDSQKPISASHRVNRVMEVKAASFDVPAKNEHFSNEHSKLSPDHFNDLSRKPIKMSSLDSVSGYTSQARNATFDKTADIVRPQAQKLSLSGNSDIPLRLHITGFKVLGNVSVQQPSISQSSYLSSSNTNLRSTMQKENRDISADVRCADVGVNTSELRLKTSCGVQTDPAFFENFPKTSDNSKHSARIILGTESEEGPEEKFESAEVHRRNEKSPVPKLGRRHKSELDLAGNRNWRQEYSNSYSEESLRSFVPPVVHGERQNRVPERNNTEMETYLFGWPVQKDDSKLEDAGRFHGRGHPEKSLVQKASLRGNRAGSPDSIQRQQVENKPPVSIQQRISDHRAVTVVTIGSDEAPFTTANEYNHHHKQQQQPASVKSLVSQFVSPAARDQENRRNTVIPPSAEMMWKNNSQNVSNNVKAVDSKAEMFTPKSSRWPSLQTLNSAPRDSGIPQRIGLRVTGKSFDDVPQYSSALPVTASRSNNARAQVIGGAQRSEVLQSVDQFADDWQKPNQSEKSQHKSSYDALQNDQIRVTNTHHNPLLSTHTPTRSHSIQRVGSVPRNIYRHDNTKQQSENSQFAADRSRPTDLSQSCNIPRRDAFNTKIQSTSMDADGPITWSVTELKKRFDATTRNSHQSSPQRPIKATK